MEPSADERALWAAIRASPADDLPRLVYADWLEEHRRGERAELIRAQIALAGLPTERRKARADRARLTAREAELLAAHADGWLSRLRAVLTMPPAHSGYIFNDAEASRLRFVRGLPDFTHCGFAAATRLADAEDDLGPVNSFLVVNDHARDGYDPEKLERVAAWPGAGCVNGVGCLWATDRDVFAVAGSTSLRNLVTLSFADSDITDAGVAALAGWPLAGRLEHVDFQAARITDAGAAALINSPYLGSLTSLDVRDTDISPAGRAGLQWRFRGVLPGAER